MKHTFKVFAAAIASIAAASCAKEIQAPTDKTQEPLANITITASIPQSKVSFSEDELNTVLKGSWEIDDEILAMVEGSSPISMKVVSIDPETGSATLSTDGALSEGDKVYAIYCPGASIEDIENNELPLDFSFQAANNVPALMVSTSTVADATLELSFSNCLCIIGIVKPNINIKTDGRTMTRVIASGHEIVSSGKVVVNEGVAVFEPGAPDKFIYKSVVGRELVTVDDTHATFADPVYIAVPASKVEKITMMDSKKSIRAYQVNKTATAGKYARINEKEFKSVSLPADALKVEKTVWAAYNLGAEEATKNNYWGDLYRWAETNLIYTARSQKTIDTWESSHSGGFTTPVSGEIYYDGSRYNKYTAIDQKSVLDPVDDPVQIAYPGTGWRMPTIEEFNALSSSGLSYEYSKSGVGVYIGDNKELFFPRVFCTNTKGTAISNVKSRYWTSSMDLSNTKKPFFFEILASDKATTTPYSNGAQYRYFGFAIRPVRTSKAD